jgi:hypothetical protein
MKHFMDENVNRSCIGTTHELGGSDTICNNPGKSASHICAITPKGLVNLELP